MKLSGTAKLDTRKEPALPFYFLDVVVGERLTFEDDIGAEFASLDDARAEALDALAEIADAQSAMNAGNDDLTIIVRDRPRGEMLLSVGLPGPKNDN